MNRKLTAAEIVKLGECPFCGGPLEYDQFGSAECMALGHTFADQNEVMEYHDAADEADTEWDVTTKAEQREEAAFHERQGMVVRGRSVLTLARQGGVK